MKYNTVEIEEKANRLLNGMLEEVFAQNNKILAAHPSKLNQEVGIDYFMEIRDRQSGESLNIILNQNKGTDNLSIIKTKAHPEYGKITFSLKLRHAKYFLNEISNPLFFTVCDIKTDKIYWYWIQLDESINARIQSQELKNKKSLQIYIPKSNELNINNFENFYRELDKCDRYQTHKSYRVKLPKGKNYNFKDLEVSSMHIVDILKASIKRFEGISTIPAHILQRVYPFKGTTDHTYIVSETLYTDSTIIYDFFESLSSINGTITVKSAYTEKVTIEGFEDKLKEVLEFLKINLIHHFKWNGKGYREQICIHDLFEYDNSCDCERCSYNRMNFKVSALKLEKTKPAQTLIDKFKSAYTHYLLGNLREAVQLYSEINTETKKNENTLLNILCKYNLIKLKNLVRSSFLENGKNRILSELEDVDFALDEILIENNYHKDVFEFIKEERFFNNALWEIDRLLVEIKTNHRNDKKGGYFVSKHIFDFKFEFLRISYFIEFNLIIYDVFREYQLLIHKSLESMFALYDIHNPDSSNYQKIEYTFIHNWLMYANPSKMNHILLKYNANEIRLNNEVESYERLNENLGNLISSVEYIIENKKNSLFRVKVKNIIQNFAYVLSRIKFNANQINTLLRKYSELIILLKDDYLISMIRFETLFHYRKDITIENTEKILKLLNDNDLCSTQSFYKCFDYYLSLKNREKGNLELTEILNKLDDKVNKELIEPEIYSNFSKYESLLKIDFLRDEIKNIIQFEALDRLKNKFDSEYYYNLSIYSLIPYEKNLFDNLVMSIQDSSLKPSAREVINGVKQRKNYNLSKLINLCYKFNLPFSDKIKDLSKFASESEYYDWLMDLSGFDYSNFNQYWLLEYKTNFYFEEFKKHPKLKQEIKKALERNYIEGVAKLYIDNF